MFSMIYREIQIAIFYVMYTNTENSCDLQVFKWNILSQIGEETEKKISLDENIQITSEQGDRKM